MKNKKMLSIFALGIIVLLGISFVATYQGDYSVKGPNYSEERHDAMHSAFDNLDYDTWITLMTESGRNPRVLTVVTEDNFATFVEAHKAGEAGDFKKADELMAELGLRNGSGLKDGTCFGGRKGMKQGLSQGFGIGCQRN
jgi:hypothetical protein